MMEICSRAVMSLENYRHFTNDNEIILDEADRAAKETDVRYTHEEVFSELGENYASVLAQLIKQTIKCVNGAGKK